MLGVKDIDIEPNISINNPKSVDYDDTKAYDLLALLFKWKIS